MGSAWIAFEMLSMPWRAVGRRSIKPKGLGSNRLSYTPRPGRGLKPPSSFSHGSNPKRRLSSLKLLCLLIPSLLHLLRFLQGSNITNSNYRHRRRFQPPLFRFPTFISPGALSRSHLLFTNHPTRLQARQVLAIVSVPYFVCSCDQADSASIILIPDSQ